MFSRIFDDRPRSPSPGSRSDVKSTMVLDETVEVKAGGMDSSTNMDSTQWNRLLGLFDIQKKEVALSISVLKKDLEEQRKDFKDYVSRATREDAAIHIAAGKERKEALVAIAEVHTDIELLKEELKKLRCTSRPGQVAGKVESHVLRERVKEMESKLEDVVAGVDPLQSKFAAAVGQLERRLQLVSEESQGSAQRGLESHKLEVRSHLEGEAGKLRGELAGVRDEGSSLRADLESHKLEARSHLEGEAGKLRGELAGVRDEGASLRADLESHTRELHSRIEGETGRLRAELAGVHDSTAPLREDLESRVQAVRAHVQDETTRLWVEFGDFRDSTGSLRHDFESHQRDVHTRIEDETGKLQAALDDVRRQSSSSNGAKEIQEEAQTRRAADDAEAEARQSGDDELRGLIEGLGVRLAAVEAQSSRTVELSEILASRVESLGLQLRNLSEGEERGAFPLERQQQLKQAVELGDLLARRVDQQAEQLREVLGRTGELEQRCLGCVDRCARTEEQIAQSKLAMELAAKENREGEAQRRREDEAARQRLSEALEQHRRTVAGATEVSQALAGTAGAHAEEMRGLRAAHDEVRQSCTVVASRCELLAKEVAERHALEIQSLKQSHDNLAVAAENSSGAISKLNDSHGALVQQCRQAMECRAQLEVGLGEHWRSIDGSLRELRERQGEEAAARCTLQGSLQACVEQLCAEQKRTLEQALARSSESDAQRRDEDLEKHRLLKATLDEQTRELQALTERQERESAETRQLVLSAPQDAKDAIEQYRRKVERAMEVCETVAQRQEGVVQEWQGISARLQEDRSEILQILEEHRQTAKQDLVKAIEGEMAVRRRSVEEEKQARIRVQEELGRGIEQCATSLSSLEQQLCTSVDGSR